MIRSTTLVDHDLTIKQRGDSFLRMVFVETAASIIRGYLHAKNVFFARADHLFRDAGYPSV